MNVQGWCRRCGRVRRVRVTGADVARSIATGRLLTGTCADCADRPSRGETEL